MAWPGQHCTVTVNWRMATCIVRDFRVLDILLAAPLLAYGQTRIERIQLFGHPACIGLQQLLTVFASH